MLALHNFLNFWRLRCLSCSIALVALIFLLTVRTEYFLKAFGFFRRLKLQFDGLSLSSYLVFDLFDFYRHQLQIFRLTHKSLCFGVGEQQSLVDAQFCDGVPDDKHKKSFVTLFVLFYTAEHSFFGRIDSIFEANQLELSYLFDSRFIVEFHFLFSWFRQELMFGIVFILPLAAVGHQVVFGLIWKQWLRTSCHCEDVDA